MTDFENGEATLGIESDEATLGIESEDATLGIESEEGENIGDPKEEHAEEVECEEIFTPDGDRAEYERLIKERFKEHFAADTQRLINRRFKKYKALEERVRSLEAEASRYKDLDILLKSERERAIKETEERMNREFRAMRGRAQENALTNHTSRGPFDVSRLTKSERALLATRAQKGEKIHL